MRLELLNHHLNRNFNLIGEAKTDNQKRMGPHQHNRTFRVVFIKKGTFLDIF